MGFLFSKSQPANTNTIENDVASLTCKVAKQETTINRIVKEEILNALEIYTNEIQRNKKEKIISPEKARKIQNLINTAKQSVKSLATQKIPDSKINSDGSDVYTMKANLLFIAKEAEKTTMDESEEALRRAIFFTERLQNCPTDIINETESTTISIGFLRLFLKCPQKQAAEVLQENVFILHKSKENFDQIQMQNVSPFNITEIETKLLEIKKCSEAITELSSKELEHINKKLKETSNFSQTNQLQNQNYNRFRSSGKDFLNQSQSLKIRKLESQKLKSVEDSLEQQRALIENLCPPIAKTLLENLKKEIVSLKRQLNNIVTVKSNIPEQRLKDQIQNKLHQLENKLKTISEATKEITKKLNLLENVKNNCLRVLQSGVPYFEKMKQIDACKKEINILTLDCSDFDVQKTNVLNSIEEVIIAETACYMRQLCMKINRYKLYSAEFPFPRRVDRYNLKKMEIGNLVEDLDRLPDNYINIKKRKQQLRENVHEVVNLLTEQANRNEKITDSLEKLEKIERKIYHNYGKRGHLFIKYRSKLALIPSDLSKKIYQKKTEIIDLLHRVETEFLSFCPEFIQKIKTNLNKLELEVQHPLSSEVYQQTKNELENLLMKHFANYYFIKEIASFVLAMLEQTYKNQQIFCNRLNNLNELETNINSASDKETLEVCEHVLDNYKINNNFSNDTLLKVQEKYYLKKCFFDLMDFDTQLDDLVKNIHEEAFINNIDMLFYIKETIEDMPQEDSQLEIAKNKVLKKISTHLQSLDEDLAKIVFNKKQPEAFLELKDHFTFDVNSLNVSRNSVEFVKIIQDQAKKYESDVLYFLGSTECIDFYIIRENLTRLLKMLDTVECESDPDLLEQVVKAVEYIKDLIRRLNLNANEE